MGIDMTTIASSIRFHEGTDEHLAVQAVVQDILVRDGYHDDDEVYRHADPSIATTWQGLFAAFRQYLLPALEDETFVSVGHDDRLYELDYLFNAAAEYMVDGSFYAYQVDGGGCNILVVHDGKSLKFTSADYDGDLQELTQISHGTTNTPATMVSPGAWWDDVELRYKVLTEATGAINQLNAS